MNHADGGLQGSVSLHMCDFHEATHEKVKTELETFRNCRNLQETKEIVELLRTNPEKLSDTHLKQIAQRGGGGGEIHNIKLNGAFRTQH